MPFKQLGLSVFFFFFNKKKTSAARTAQAICSKTVFYPLCCAYESVSVTRGFLGCSTVDLTLWSWYRSAIGLRSWRATTLGASNLVLHDFVGCTCTARSVFISRCWLDNYFTFNNNTKKVQKLTLNTEKLFHLP